MPRLRLLSLLVGLMQLAWAAPSTAAAQTPQYRSGGHVYFSLRDTGVVAAAEDALARDPRNVQRYLDLGAAQSAARRFREAIDTYTRALEIAPHDPMLLRWRGHRYISVREFSSALYDLAVGTQLDSTNYGILYHLGVLRYARGEFADAAETFARAQAVYPNAGELAGATDWLWMSLMRAGRTAEAAAMLARRPDSLPVDNAYARRLRLYRGEIGPEQVITGADTSDVTVATLAYGIGNWYWVRGDRARARGWFERSIASGGWPAFGFIMAETDLRRLQYLASRPSADSIARLYRFADSLLAPLSLARDSLVRALRPDSGTLRADSTYWHWRRVYDAQFSTAMLPLYAAGFQALSYPDGTVGYRARERFDVEGPALIEELATADSVLRYLESRGIAMVVGEGKSLFEPSETRLARRIGPLLSPAGREFLRLSALEQASPAGDDGSLHISWDELGERLAAADAYLAVPGAVGRDRMQMQRDTYLHGFFGGWPNSPAFDRDTEVLLPAPRESYERFAAARGATPLGQVMGRYLLLLRESGFRRTEAVQDFLARAVR